MKVLSCFVLCVAVVSAITVPPIWPRAPSSVTPNPRRPHSPRTHRPNRNTQYHRPRTTPRPHLTQTTQGDWIPLAPTFINQHQHYIVHETTTKRPKTHANKNVPFSHITGSRIHLAPKYHPGPEHQLVDSIEHRLPDGDELIKTNYETPVSEHEHPKDIPTRPIYPGEGQWAKPRRKHRPHNSPYKYNEPIKSPEEEKPDGYDIFERGQERFKLAQNKYQTPREPIKQAEYKDKYESEDDQEDVKQEEFVPEKLYAQVRKTEVKKHLPRSQIKREEEENADRLREVIKDSKIQTVYTEEGYEDSAYDHAGKEKKAESEEGYIRRAEEAENSGRKDKNQKQGQYSDKRGHNRGRIKHRQNKNRNEQAKIHNYDDTETYHNVKQKVEKELSDSEIGETLNQAIKVPSVEKVGSRANLHKSEQQKIEIKSTMKNGDDVNMEIHTEVKFINGSDKRKHKFVKIVPSYQRVVEPEMQSKYDSSEIEQDSSEEIYRRVKRYDREILSKRYVRKRPDYYWKRKKTESTKTTHYPTPITIKIKRQKRYTIDYPKIDVPTINFKEFQKSTIKNKPTISEDKKYPYLKVNTKVLDENSPLRYAENLDEIPQKSQDDMAFYKSRSRTSCLEVQDDVDPIPEKIKNMSIEDVPDEDKEENNGPRLQGLGDRIDCLKIKYFGEDPLDSPIFKEDTIRIAVPPIFKKISTIKGVKVDSSYKKEKKKLISPDDEYEEIDVTPKKSTKRNVQTFDPIVVDSEEDSNTTTNPINIQKDAVLKPPYTLQEVANKILKNKAGPNNIYDQINLLAVDKENIKEKNKEPNFVIVYDNQSTERNSIHNDQVVEDKIKNINITDDGDFDPQLSDVVSDLSHYSEELPSYEINNLVPENFSEYDLLLPVNENLRDEEYKNLYDEENEKSQEEKDSYLPTHAALRDYRYFSQFATKFKPSMRNTFKINSPQNFSSIIFDISKYLPQIRNHKSSTSEVQYKEDIKPSEQLNVYSDVLRAINSSTQEVDDVPDTQPITVKLHISNSTRKRNPKRKIRIKTTTVSSIVDLLTKPEDSYEENSNNINKKTNFTNMDKTSPQIFPTEVPNPPKILPEKIRSMINQYTHPLIIKVPNASKESLEISGLAPPPSLDFKYRTIPLTQPSVAIPVSTKLLLKPIVVRQSRNNVNLYYFTGLRPPSKKQLVMNYNDFNKIKRSRRHLSVEQEEDMFTAESNNEETRTARKPIMYTEIVRQRNPVPKNEDEEEEEEEDLLPRKRTYDIKPKSRTTTTERISEEDYFEVEEPAVEKPINKKPLVYENPPGLPEYIKIVDKLHEYRFTNNITTTLPEQETTTANPRATTTTAKTQTTAESINMGVPAFLQIVNSLHDIRKQQEPDTTDEIEEEIEDNEPVQNSNPYISSALTSRNEDNNEEIDTQAHIRNLSNKFRTSIDTSKYKTIERMPIMLRHNLSSRYNAEDEILPLEKIFTTKMPAVYTTTVRNEEKELILQREHSPESRSEISREDEEEESTVATTTKATRRRTGPRRRPTTSTSRSWETTTRSQIVRRRRPQKVQTSTETPTTSSSPIQRRRYRQRLEPQTSIKSYVSEIPPNHKREYVPVTEIERNGEIKEEFKRPNDINKSNWKKLYDRRIMTHRPLIKTPQETQGSEKDEEVEIIGEIKNPNMKHGGNYRHIDDVLEETTSRYRFPIRRRQNVIRSTEPTTTQAVTKNYYEDDEEETLVDQEEKPINKPKIIKDPSKRMYFYAKL